MKSLEKGNGLVEFIFQSSCSVRTLMDSLIGALFSSKVRRTFLFTKIVLKLVFVSSKTDQSAGGDSASGDSASGDSTSGDSVAVMTLEVMTAELVTVVIVLT